MNEQQAPVKKGILIIETDPLKLHELEIGLRPLLSGFNLTFRDSVWNIDSAAEDPNVAVVVLDAPRYYAPNDLRIAIRNISIPYKWTRFIVMAATDRQKVRCDLLLDTNVNIAALAAHIKSMILKP